MVILSSFMAYATTIEKSKLECEKVKKNKDQNCCFSDILGIFDLKILPLCIF